MLWVFPASLLMQRIGRRHGFRVGSVFGMTGATVVGYGLHSADFVMMCLGGLILGYAVACLHMYRFAAVELVPPAYRARAISWVTAGGVVAGVIGPSLVRLTHDQWVPIYVATYAAMVGLHLIVFTIMSFIRFPPMQEAPAGTHAAAAPPAPPRPLWRIAAQPRFAAAVISGMVAFGTMSFLMTASPLAIVACGLPHTEAHWVIFMHVMGMFVPSFFTGNLISRFGTTPVMFAGIALLALGVAAALTGMLRRGGILISLLVLPLAVPTLIFGVGLLDPLAGPAALKWLAATTLVALSVSPFAAGAGLRAALE
jgi:predicted MFS family arabinose efflux permease